MPQIGSKLFKGSCSSKVKYKSHARMDIHLLAVDEAFVG